MKTNDLERRLMEARYTGLFLHGNNSQAESLWNDGKNRRSFENIIEKADSPPEAKFLSAEVLRHFRVQSNPKHAPMLAEAYAYALAHSSIEKEDYWFLDGNLWGFLYEMDDAGPLGKQLVEFGEAAIPHLKKLLDDNAKIIYEGSQEATIGNEYQYRIKDFAAFYISKIKNIPVVFHQELTKRDEEIERLKRLL